MSQKKICILIEQLSGGGAERSAAILSQVLTDLGYQISIITLFDEIGYDYQGKLINLGNYKKGSRSPLHKYGRYVQLKRHLQKADFDLILDFRMKNFAVREYLLNKWVFKAEMVNMVRSYRLDWYFPKPEKLSLKLYCDYFGIVGVSKSIQQRIEREYSFLNVSTIYNSLPLKNIRKKSVEPMKLPKNYVLAVGRHNSVKQFDQLIKTYATSTLPKQNIKLLILGDDLGSNLLAKTASQAHVADQVILKPFQQNPFPFYKNADFLILSSKNEGFPNVLVESLACGTPVVSFDCLSGPSEIVQHEQNGLLIEDQDFEALKTGMEQMVSDEKLYAHCASNAVESVQKFSLENISKEWEKFLADAL